MTLLLLILFIIFVITLYVKIRQIEDRLYILQKFTIENSSELSNIKYSYNERMKHEENKNNILYQR
jgi:predicted GH43/DUF377 family glycosyl hydrolase